MTATASLLSDELRKHVALWAALTVLDGSPTPDDLARIQRGERLPEGRRKPITGVTPYEFIAARGHSWDGSVLPSRYRRGIPRNCYQNAWEKARRSSTLYYCEGMGVSADLGLPVAHAWLYDPERQQVVEPTWDLERTTHSYLGFVFPLEIVREARQRSGRDSIAVFEGDWARGGWFMREAADTVAEFTVRVMQEGSGC